MAQTVHVEGVPVIQVEGQIDLDNYVEVHDLILEELRVGRPRIVLNLRKLDFLDSTMLGMLLRSLDTCRREGGALVVVTNPTVDRVLSLTGLTNLFELFSSETEALSSFSPAT